ncbi:MAG TPA: hypothetical protein VML55_12360 [Planctomycetaceae bacterium]|nr:hypothetical protein [Planctomycetaceae bacterium]
MRISVPIALAATVLAAGCATNRCGDPHDCCNPPAACLPAGRCAVPPPPIPDCLGTPPLDGVPAAPAPDEAPLPPADPVEPAPEPPATAQRLIQEVVEDTEPQTTPVSTFIDDADTIYGHDGEYRWLMGELQRVHVPGGEWKLRYSPLDVQDHWGGSVVLATDVRLDDFADGDIVYVDGEILAARPSLYLSGPLYRVRTIRPANARDKERVARQIP